MSRRILMAASLLSLVWPITGSAQVQLNGPETIVYDTAGDRYLVSNMNTNRIIGIDRNGSYSVFSTAVNHPYGMTIWDGVLYVGGDRGGQGGITGIDLATGTVVFELLSYSWYYCVNGVTADTSGHIFFACTGGSMIHRLDIASGTSAPIASIPIPNAVCYDARHDRLFVTTNQWGSNLYAVDLDDYSVSTFPFRYGQFSGLTLDPLNNLYVAYFAGGQVYRVDSTLAGTVELVAGGQYGPEGICFDRVHSVLCVPNLMANTVSFHPQQIDVWILCDSTHGWVPFELMVTGSSILGIASWSWDFGDGGHADGPFASHIYDAPGTYEVGLTAITATGDTLVRTYTRQIASLADSLWAESVYVVHGPGDTVVEVTIHARNNVPVREFQIPVVYDGPIDLEYDGFSTAGCRSESFEGQILEDLVPESKRLTLRLLPRVAGAPLYADAGSGPIVRLSFVVHDPPASSSTPIALAGYGSYASEFLANGFDYVPIVVSGAVTSSTCCIDITGNVNGDVDERVDATDLIYLVNYVFKSGPTPPCLDEANVNGAAGVNSSDLIYLVNYVFKSGPDPAGCE